MPTIQKTLPMFKFICRVIEAGNEPPTIAELQRQFGFSSPGSVYAHLKKMVAKGWITIVPNVSRGIRIVERQDKAA